MTDSSSGFPLTMAGENTPVRVIALTAGAGIVRRLIELGLNVGSELMVCQRQGPGGMVIARGETRFALGLGMASKIMVCQI